MAKLGNGLLSGDYSKQQQQSSSQSDTDQYVVRYMRDAVSVYGIPCTQNIFIRPNFCLFLLIEVAHF